MAKNRQREMIATLIQIHDHLGVGVKDKNNRISYNQDNIKAIRKALAETLKDYHVTALPISEKV